MDKIREPLRRDKVVGSSENKYHVAVELAEYGDREVYLTIWPVAAGCEAQSIDFVPAAWDEIKALVDEAIKDYEDEAQEEPK